MSGYRKQNHGSARNSQYSRNVSSMLRRKYGIHCNGRDAILNGVKCQQFGRGNLAEVTITVGYSFDGDIPRAITDANEIAEIMIAEGYEILRRNMDGRGMSVVHPSWRKEK